MSQKLSRRYWLDVNIIGSMRAVSLVLRSVPGVDEIWRSACRLAPPTLEPGERHVHNIKNNWHSGQHQVFRSANLFNYLSAVQQPVTLQCIHLRFLHNMRCAHLCLHRLLHWIHSADRTSETYLQEAEAPFKKCSVNLFIRNPSLVHILITDDRYPVTIKQRSCKERSSWHLIPYRHHTKTFHTQPAGAKPAGTPSQKHRLRKSDPKAFSCHSMRYPVIDRHSITGTVRPAYSSRRHSSQNKSISQSAGFLQTV